MALFVYSEKKYIHEKSGSLPDVYKLLNKQSLSLLFFLSVKISHAKRESQIIYAAFLGFDVTDIDW